MSSESGPSDSVVSPAASEGLIKRVARDGLLSSLMDHRSKVVSRGAILIALGVGAVVFWEAVKNLLQKLGAGFDWAAYNIQAVDTWSTWEKVVSLVAGISLVAAASVCAARSASLRNKVISTVLGSFPFLLIIILFGTSKGYAEVAAHNIGLVLADGSGHQVLEAAVRELGPDSGETGVFSFDLAQNGEDAVLLRQFVDRNRIKYLVISAPIGPATVEAVHRAVASRGLTLITTPEARLGANAAGPIGVFVSPEAEADRIESELTGQTRSRALLLYEQSPPNEETFESRFRAKLTRSSRIDILPWPLAALGGDNTQLWHQVALADTIIIAARGRTALDAARGIRRTNPRARLISTSRVLDHAHIDDLSDLRLETPLPWQVLASLSGYERRASTVSQAPPRPVVTSSTAAVRLAAVIESRFGHRRPRELRSLFFSEQRQWVQELEREYGDPSFIDGPLPHLRVGDVHLALFRNPD